MNSLPSSTAAEVQTAACEPASTGEEATTAVVLNFEVSTGDARVELRLDQSASSQRNMAASFEAGEFYEPEVSYFITSVLQPGDQFVDVGAHIGYFSLLASRAVGEGGR